MTKEYSLKLLAEEFSLSFIGDPECSVRGFAPLGQAKEGDIAFVEGRYLSLLSSTRASVVCIKITDYALGLKGNFLLTESPKRTFESIVKKHFLEEPLCTGFSGIHPTAVVHPEACLGKNVSIGPYVVIDRAAQIGDDVSINSFSYIGPGVVIGKKCQIDSHVMIAAGAVLAAEVVVQAGAKIGTLGFGFELTGSGEWQRTTHIGSVHVGEKAEIAANSIVERARFTSTLIGAHAKIGNLSVVGHNSQIGARTLLAGMVGVGGGTSIGEDCLVGGQVGFAGHTFVANQVRIAAQSGVTVNLSKSGTAYGGSPAKELSDVIAERKRQRMFQRDTEEGLRKLKSALESQEDVRETMANDLDPINYSE